MKKILITQRVDLFKNIGETRESIDIKFFDLFASLKMLPIYVEQSRNFPKATYLTCDAEPCRRVCTIFDICAIPAMAAFKNNKLLYKAEGASTTTWQQCAIDVAVDEGWVK